ncbi:hypothetical protein ADLECEL_04630 [Adlercreutzia equolifaciens subsp. celatus]|nr:hypothetical protein ADLECEL_04630 [Adlercreutzia equolifaciens subsp. celatus]
MKYARFHPVAIVDGMQAETARVAQKLWGPLPFGSRRGRPWSPLFCRAWSSHSLGLTKVSPYGGATLATLAARVEVFVAADC